MTARILCERMLAHRYAEESLPLNVAVSGRRLRRHGHRLSKAARTDGTEQVHALRGDLQHP